MSIDNLVVIVTGASGDIGGRVVDSLLQTGHRVAALDYEVNANARASAERYPADYRFCQLDVRDKAAVDDAVDGIERAWTRIDGLVNCAGIFRPKPFLQLTDEDWDSTIGVNLDGTFWTCQAVARRMISGGRGGRIVNISSGLAFKGGAEVGHYAASKAGVEGITHTLARELATHNITVNALAPGMVAGRMTGSVFNERVLARAAEANPSGRLALPEDIAEVVVFLLGPDSAFITGQIIHINGGGLMI